MYSLISSISSDFYIFTPWSVGLFIRVPYQLPVEHTVLQQLRRIELIIDICVLPGTYFHLSQVKHFRVNMDKCLAKDTTSKYCSNIKHFNLCRIHVYDHRHDDVDGCLSQSTQRFHLFSANVCYTCAQLTEHPDIPWLKLYRPAYQPDLVVFSRGWWVLYISPE